MAINQADHPKLHELAVVERTVVIHASLKGRIANEPVKLEVLRRLDTGEYMAHISLRDSASNPVCVHHDSMVNLPIDERITDPAVALELATEQALRWLALRCV